MALTTSETNQVRVDVLGVSVDQSTSWTTTGPAGNRNALADTILERVITRLLNNMNVDILGSVGATNGFAARFNTVVGDETGADLAAFQSLGDNLIQVAATGAGRSYQFDQVTPATTWNITHGLDRQFVAVQLISDTGNTMIADINYIDDDDLVVTFAIPKAGTAVIRR